jgi:hypothetical protein
MPKIDASYRILDELLVLRQSMGKIAATERAR